MEEYRLYYINTRNREEEKRHDEQMNHCIRNVDENQGQLYHEYLLFPDVQTYQMPGHMECKEMSPMAERGEIDL